MNAPPIIWLDERIAAGLPKEKDVELFERGVDQIRYVSQSRVNDLVNAAKGGDEFIVQVDGASGMIYGLSNFGRLWAFGQALGIQDRLDGIPGQRVGWYLIADRELPSDEPTSEPIPST